MVLNLLQFEGQFLPINIDKKTTVHEFIKHIENYNRHLNEINKIKIHTLTILLFHRLFTFEDI